MSFAPISRYLNLRTLVLLGLYGLISGCSYWIGFELRFDFIVPEDFVADRDATLWWVIGLQLMLLAAGGQLDSILSYFRLPDAMRLFGALFANCLAAFDMVCLFRDGVPPRSVVLTYFILSFFVIGAFRVLMRLNELQPQLAR